MLKSRLQLLWRAQPLDCRRRMPAALHGQAVIALLPCHSHESDPRFGGVNIRTPCNRGEYRLKRNPACLVSPPALPGCPG